MAFSLAILAVVPMDPVGFDARAFSLSSLAVSAASCASAFCCSAALCACFLADRPCISPAAPINACTPMVYPSVEFSWMERPGARPPRRRALIFCCAIRCDVRVLPVGLDCAVLSLISAASLAILWASVSGGGSTGIKGFFFASFLLPGSPDMDADCWPGPLPLEPGSPLPPPGLSPPLAVPPLGI